MNCCTSLIQFALPPLASTVAIATLNNMLSCAGGIGTDAAARKKCVIQFVAIEYASLVPRPRFF